MNYGLRRLPKSGDTRLQGITYRPYKHSYQYSLPSTFAGVAPPSEKVLIGHPPFSQCPSFLSSPLKKYIAYMLDLMNNNTTLKEVQHLL